MEKTWREAIVRVLREAKTPLSLAELTQRILDNGYYKTDGATPKATVSTYIKWSIDAQGERSPFVRVSKGIFALKDSVN